MKRPLHPAFVGAIAGAVAVTNFLTIRIPEGVSPAGYLVGFLGFPILVAVIYAIWYFRRYRRE